MNRVKLLVLLSALFVGSNAFSSSSTLIKAELDAFDQKSNQVIINGKRYDLNINVNLSAYSSDNLNAKLVKTGDLEAGLSYYFNLYSEDNNDDENYTEVIFISNEEPES